MARVPDPDFRRLNDVKQALVERFSNSDDLIVRSFRLGLDGKTGIVIAYIDGMAERRAVDEDVVKPLMVSRPPVRRRRPIADIVTDHLLHVAQIIPTEDMSEVVKLILSGDVAVFIAGHRIAYLLDLKGFPHRGAEKPTSEFSLKGSLEGFSESVKTNVLLVRRRIQSPNLKVMFHTVGRTSNNLLAVMYVDSIANPALVAELRRRLSSIDHEALQQTSLIQSLITDNPWTVFPLYRDTERPDVVAKSLLNGKIAILLDNTPFAVIMPTVLLDFFQTSDDYTVSFWSASFIRTIRLLAILMGFLLPPLYIAFLSFRPELLPIDLAQSVAASREGIPFPPLVEVVIMLLVVEILREAAIRIPMAGPTVAIVGGLVVGTAAAEAQIVSVLMLIVVALTALAHFVMPGFEISITIRLLLWFFLAASAVLGLIGLTLAMVLIAAHVASLNSLGLPYTAPLAPFSRSALTDSIWRAPLFELQQRPQYVHPLQSKKTSLKQEQHRTPDPDREVDQVLESLDDEEN